MNQVLLPIGDGTEMMDTLYPCLRLPEDDFRVVVTAPEARRYHGVMHEIPPSTAIPWDITREQPSYHIAATVALQDVDPREYIGLFLSGGRAPEYLRYDEDLLRITRHFVDAGKPVGVTCHGIEILAAAGCLEGRKATTVAKCRLDVTQFGGVYVDQPVVVDGNLVSSRTWHDYSEQFPPFVELLRRATTNGNGAVRDSEFEEAAE
ncbi:General stress protein 18 [Planctomycetes bacterium Pan216]|uniref:General stress protein 18 n=1 Tax=Kolteria novifilia TaxID=2527975 RepID=A0A518AZV8_9BACT|nr:General stress protein 18 [Planctomycetes bacterium Pan216]